jgi:uncharacterized protein
LPGKIVVTGDTHLGRRRDWLPAKLVEGLEWADLAIHTGDFSTKQAWELFARYGDLLAVAGNNDEAELLEHLPEQLTIETGDTRILVVHGHLERGRSAADAVVRAFAGSSDLVIFGHSHRPMLERIAGTLFLNPGSPTMRRREPQFSYALMEMDQSGGFQVEFVRFDEQVRPIPRD